MKLIVSALLLMSSSLLLASDFDKGFDVFKCEAGGSLKLELIAGTNKEVRIHSMGLDKDLHLADYPVYRKSETIANLPYGMTTKEVDATKIILKNPDNTYYDKEYYTINLKGNLLIKKATARASGTIVKTLIPYGIIGYRVPIVSPETEITCTIKIQ